MNIPKYLIVPILAVAVTACRQNTAPKSTDTIDKADTVANTKAADTTTVDMPGDKPVPLAQLIVPGISIGQTAINESSENVHKKLGSPDGGDAAMGKSISIWYANHDSTGYVTQMYFSRGQGDDEVKRVKQIRVTSPSFKLSGKVYTGTPFNNIKQTYQLKKTAIFTDKGKELTLYDDVKAGLAFDVDSKGIISGITVHEPGREAASTYLPFFSTLKQLK
ncbi:hypothetical protein ACFQZI_15925 [Mucilaginibacter lutimaris]|uniref:Lipoprotein n=1 Tax=Mucilaginibacter lutimaris TaxID=931629 RepID=A0ABW2ZJI3_9SPHI